jgi:LysM repeat protein
MSENFGRVFGGMAALAVIWIIVYWWWEPRGGAITFDTGSRAAVSPSGDFPQPSGGPLTNLDPAPAEGEAPPVNRSSGPSPSSSRSPAPAVIAPQFRLYTVKSGDTLARIAERELGSRAYADAIIRSNPLTSPENLAKAGRQIKLPLDPSNIRGAPNPEASAPPLPETAARPAPSDATPPETAPPADAGFTEYTVKEGDTLTEISRAHYGTIKHADLIAQANGIDADHLKIGQKLKLPPKPR